MKAAIASTSTATPNNENVAVNVAINEDVNTKFLAEKIIESSWLVVRDHGFIVSRTDNMVYFILK